MARSAGMKKLGLVAGFALLAGCVAPETAPPADPPLKQGAAPSGPVAHGTEEQGLVQGSTAFGIDLYRKFAATETNIFLSPISISTAFAMVQAGARGETAAEMARTLRYNREDRLHPEMGALIRRLPIRQEGRQFTLANALWVQQGYVLRPEYLQTVERNYGAKPALLDFRSRPEAARAINRWAEQSTNGRIRNMISPTDLDPDTRLVLANAVWFKADWQQQFNAARTSPRDFHPRGGAVVRTPFMHQIGSFRHLDRPGFQAIELPYRGEEMSMIVFLPNARDGLPAFERELTPARLEEWMGALTARERQRVDLALPKIQLETRYDLPPPLMAMGMLLAFSNKSDLGGITDVERLKVDRAIHQTFLLVDEKGTEAAAATVISVVPTSAPAPPQIRFHADHPFFFLIRDNRSGATLFIGRLEAPPATG
jgi:serine protease inhibitor